MSLIYNATFDKNTRKLSFEDKAGNEIYSFIVPERVPAVDDTTKPLTFRATQDGSTVSLLKGGSPDGAFQTSRDGGNTWVDYTIGTDITLNIGEKASFRSKADRTSEQSYTDYFYFKMTGKIEAWHNVMSLYRTSDFATYNNAMVLSFNHLFDGCTSLTKAPVLPATTLATECYQFMFNGCTSLKEAPELPATTLSDYCYSNMFKGCTSLTKAPVLPATTLANRCYQFMFGGGTSLTKAPELPATTLSPSCYQNMFSDCTSLTKAPELPATTLSPSCYDYMFRGCRSLNEVRCKISSSYSSSQISSSYTSNWLSGVSSTGTFYTNADANWPSGASGIPTGWTRVNEGAPAVDDTTKPLTFRATQDGSSVKLKQNGSPSGSFQTSTDGGNTWTDYTLGTAIALNTGDEVSFRAKTDRTSVQSGQNYFYFEMTGEIESWHNVMSLYRTNDFATYNTVVDYAFNRLFYGCTSLTKAPVLPATTLTNNCYQFMFNGCTSLVNAPALSATTLAKSCYSNMFNGCTSLTKAPELTATTLVDYCYSGMFSGCTALTKAPVLPATTLALFCYNSMFKGCTSLSEAPELPATTLAKSCYNGMFNGCTSLTKAPALPTTTLANNCYSGMFSGCTSLTKAPELPATTLVTYCYMDMFNGCTALTRAPVLPATTLANYCYYGMFKGCTSLTKAPALPATTLADNCYNSMFRGCRSLNEVRCKISSSYSSSQISSYAKDWLFEVASTGTFYTNADANWPSGASGIPKGWTRVNEGAPAVDDISKPLTFRATQDGSKVTLKKYVSPTGDFQTSRDGGNTWTDYTLGTAIALNTGDEVSFRAKADRTSEQNDLNYFYFMMEGKIEAWHNVMSLYRTNDFATYESVMKYAFYRLFKDCTSLTKAPVLPATTLAETCYGYMFSGCQSLTKAPVLPTTTLADSCYFNMFNGCTSLAESPELPATGLVLQCYYGMFEGCTSLTKAPALPATTLVNYCYSNMFYGCTSLVNAPELPATTLAIQCYNRMFSGCTSLTEAPELTATKLANRCYQSMFEGCTSLTKAPELTATTLAQYCYQKTFYGCSSLNEVRCHVPSTISTEDIPTYTGTGEYAWLNGVSSTGTFYTNADANWPSGASGIPTGWTRVPKPAPAVSDITKPLTFRATQNGSTVSLKKNGLPEGADFQTSRDGGNTWTDYTIDSVITLNTGDEVSFRAKADREFEQSESKYFQFKMTGKIEAWHNVMSLYRTSDFATYESVMKYAFYNLFKDCTSLTKAPRLPATTLAQDCYRNMFYGCTSLTKAPELPATRLASYCYKSMFLGCTSLTEVPIFSATRLGTRCYWQMFSGCSSLNEVHCKIPSSYSTENMSVHADGWLLDVSPTGTFYTNADANWSSGSTSGIPEGWTRVNS